jgi:hypothetical protein
MKPSNILHARDVFAEPELPVVDANFDELLAVEHQAQKSLTLEDDSAVHRLGTRLCLLHEDTDDTIAPFPAETYKYMHRSVIDAWCPSMKLQARSY